MIDQLVQGGKCVVLGAGKSGLAAVRLLRARGAEQVVLADDRPSDAAVESALAAGLSIVSGPAVSAELARAALVVKSPGIAPSHPGLQAAKSAGASIIGELEMAWACRPAGARVLAITGTNGKTTTTAWAAHLLRQCGITAPAVGNIGTPFAEAVLQPEFQDPATVFVVEASSFQLDDTVGFAPDVAIMTNFTPDHLDRYGTLEAYYASKQRVWKNMAAGSLLVLNGDAENLRGFAAGAACRVARFHRASPPPPSSTEPAAYVDGDGMIWLRNAPASPQAVPLLPARELSLPGPHNLENGLAAALAAAQFLGNKPLLPLAEGLRNFEGVPHRIEHCGTAGGVRFYNDSKATNVDATEKALRSFPPRTVVLIAGGRDKHSDYGAIAPLVAERVRVLVTLGEAAPLIERAWGPPLVPSIIRAQSMAQAVELAAAAAQPGDVVLLSPACASFDMYKNYEERGEDFKQEVISCMARQTLD